MSPEELSALVALLNRVPLSEPERLWVRALVDRLAREVREGESVSRRIDESANQRIDEE